MAHCATLLRHLMFIETNELTKQVLASPWFWNMLSSFSVDTHLLIFLVILRFQGTSPKYIHPQKNCCTHSGPEAMNWQKCNSVGSFDILRHSNNSRFGCACDPKYLTDPTATTAGIQPAVMPSWVILLVAAPLLDCCRTACMYPCVEAPWSHVSCPEDLVSLHLHPCRKIWRHCVSICPVSWDGWSHDANKNLYSSMLRHLRYAVSRDTFSVCVAQ